ncbi:Glyoxalase 3, partial [Tolypocladium paradoxum]
CIEIGLTPCRQIARACPPVRCPRPQGRNRRRLPQGGVAPLDPGFAEMFKADESSANLFKNHKSVWESTKPLKDFVGRSSGFDALFYPGGHGPMYDLVYDKDSIQLIEEFYKAVTLVAAACHGPIVCAHAKVNGEPLLMGREVAGFAKRRRTSEAMPFLREDELKTVGAKFALTPQAWDAVVVEARSSLDRPRRRHMQRPIWKFHKQ